MDDINDLLSVHGNAVYSFCLYLAKNKHDGEDLFQDVMLKAVQFLPRIDRNKNPKSFLLSIAVNLWRNTAQKRARRNRILPAVDLEEAGDVFADCNTDVEKDAVNREIHDALNTAINNLDDRLRIPIILFYSEEMKISEIASLLKKPEGTIKRLLYEAKGKIKQEMEVKGYGQ